MTVAYNVNSISLLLSIFCLAIVLLGGWYFQRSIDELRTMVVIQQEVIMEQKKEMIEQKKKFDKSLLQQQSQSKVGIFMKQ